MPTTTEDVLAAIRILSRIGAGNPVVISQSQKLRDAVLKNPASPLLRNRLGILYDNATGGGESPTVAESRLIGAVLVHLSEIEADRGRGQPRLSADEETITARVPMSESMHKHCMAKPGGLAAYLRSLVEADRAKR